MFRSREVAGLVKTTVAAALLVFALLLAWAFEARSLPALQIWHKALVNEFTAHEATPQSTLRDYLDRKTRLFDEFGIRSTSAPSAKTH